MPVVDKKKDPLVLDKPREAYLDIQDTEFILRHLMESKYGGLEIEQASSTLKKIKIIHKKLMGASIEV
jgi:hypothetical protein